MSSSSYSDSAQVAGEKEEECCAIIDKFDVHGDVPVEEAETTLSWKGYTWVVKSTDGDERKGPGCNYWITKNATVDAKGHLHLNITNQNGKWYCAEIFTQKSLGFGTYEFWVKDQIDQLDQNVVFGLFNYRGPDGTNEIDIEFSQFGDPKRLPGNYSVYPAINLERKSFQTYQFPLKLDSSTCTIHRFHWQSSSVSFESFKQHKEDNFTLINRWTFTPTNSDQLIPQTPMSSHLNLWLFRGNPPTDKQIQEVEVVIQEFKFVPAEQSC